MCAIKKKKLHVKGALIKIQTQKKKSFYRILQDSVWKIKLLILNIR